jgi:hypothetical protein
MNTTFYTLSGSAFASRDSVVGMATGLRAAWSGFESLQGERFFSFTQCPDGFWGPTQRPVQWVPRFFPGCNWARL